MTRPEQDQEIAQVVGDHAEERDRLACLESKAARLVGQLESVVKLLKEQDDSLIEPTGSGLKIMPKTSDQYELDVPCRDDLVNVVCNLRKSRSRIHSFLTARGESRGSGLAAAGSSLVH